MGEQDHVHLKWALISDLSGSEWAKQLFFAPVISEYEFNMLAFRRKKKWPRTVDIYQITTRDRHCKYGLMSIDIVSCFEYLAPGYPNIWRRLADVFADFVFILHLYVCSFEWLCLWVYEHVYFYLLVLADLEF